MPSCNPTSRDRTPTCAKAYQELYRVYGEDGLVLGQMYQTCARDWYNENITMRKFSSPMAVRNLANDVPDEAVNVLMDVTKKNSRSSSATSS